MGVTATVTGNDLRVRVTREDSAMVPENVMVWVDGRLVCQLHNPGGHGWVQSRGTSTVTVRGELFRPEPGRAVVTASVWPGNNARGTYYATAVEVGGTPTRYARPDAFAGTIGATPIGRSLFHAPPKELRADGYAGLLKGAGVTHLELQSFVSPAFNPSWDTFAKWREAWEYLVKEEVDWAGDHGFRVVALGDELCRGGAENAWLLNTPWARDAVRHAAAYLRYSGVCDGVEVVDEAGGPDAHPAAGAVVEWWRSAGGPPLAWPNVAPLSWETPRWSDRSSRYGVWWEWRSGRPDGPSAGQLPQRFLEMVKGVPPDRPLVLTASAAGPHYGKRGPGGDYVPGRDHLHNGGTPPELVPAQCWMAVGHGASHVRAYGYDATYWRLGRLAAPAGTDDLQTGTRPFDPRWQGLAAGFTSVGLRDAGLFGTRYAPVYAGPWFFGRRGRYEFAVNCSDRTLPPPPGFPAAADLITPAGEHPAGPVPPGGVLISPPRSPS